MADGVGWDHSGVRRLRYVRHGRRNDAGNDYGERRTAAWKEYHRPVRRFRDDCERRHAAFILANAAYSSIDKSHDVAGWYTLRTGRRGEAEHDAGRVYQRHTQRRFRGGQRRQLDVLRHYAVGVHEYWAIPRVKLYSDTNR